MLKSKFYETPSSGLLGYSTPASAEDQAKYATGISKEAAVTLLRNYVKEKIDKEINNFVKTKNIDLSIGQHNALALHVFNKGGWANRDTNLMSAITSRKTGNEMVAAFVAVRSHTINGDTETLRNTLDLSLCEAGLYLNGLYSMSGLSYALQDNNGDEAADAVVAYVSATGYNLDSTGSLGWYVFDGTKDGTIKGSPIASLTGDHNGKLIVKKTTTAAEYTINSSDMINLNVYKDKNISSGIKGTLAEGTEFKVTKEEMVGADKWVYGTGTNTNGSSIKGWINLGEHAVIENKHPTTIKPDTSFINSFLICENPP
jgi:hypothetical protein